MFATSVDAILAVDPMRYIVLASPFVSRIFGCDPDELVGRSISILYARTKDFIEQGRLRYSREAEDSLSAYEVEYRRKDGSTFPGEASGRKILSSEGSGVIAGYMVTIRDISRRRQLMNALAREKEQWFVTLKSLGDRDRCLGSRDLHEPGGGAPHGMELPRGVGAARGRGLCGHFGGDS
ncbi:MAG: PAS domain-containing protein [Leptospirillia bacterium]